MLDLKAVSEGERGCIEATHLSYKWAPVGTKPKITIRPIRKNGRDCFQVNVPKSIGGRRMRPIFETKIAASEWRDDFERLKEAHGLAGIASRDDGLSRAAEKFMTSFREKQPSRRHLAAMTSWLHRLTRRYGSRALALVGPFEIEDFLSSLTASIPKKDRIERPASSTTKRQAFAYLRIFFNWCERRDLIVKNPCRRIDPPRGKAQSERDIFPIPEIEYLLEYTQFGGALRAYVCLNVLAGFRDSECFHIEPENLNWKRQRIFLPAGKTGSRYVSMTPAFIRHMPQEWTWPTPALFRKARALLREQMAATPDVDPARWKYWPKNAGRTSFISYMLALEQNAPKLAHEVGHKGDVTMIHRVYAVDVDPDDGALFAAL